MLGFTEMNKCYTHNKVKACLQVSCMENLNGMPLSILPLILRRKVVDVEHVSLVMALIHNSRETKYRQTPITSHIRLVNIWPFFIPYS